MPDQIPVYRPIGVRVGGPLGAAFDPCPECNAGWFVPHAPRCSVAAQQFLKALADDGRAVSDNDPRCPKCGMPDQHWVDGSPPHAGDGDTWTNQCGDCGHEYRLEMLVLYRFRIRATAETPATPGASTG